ncbi:MAG: flippase, partial [Clostridia bacterium]|nr:flippase [Clostridia bacterium]
AYEVVQQNQMKLTGKFDKSFSNACWIIGCKLIKAVLTLVTTMITARYLGVSDFGVINYAAGLVAFVVPIMKLGIDSVLVHQIVEKPDAEGEIMGTSIVLNLASAFLCMLGIGAFVCIANRGEEETIIVCVIYSVLLVFQAVEMLQYWFQAKLMSKYSSIAMLCAYIVVAAVQILMIVFKVNIYWFALSYSIDYLFISLILMIAYAKKGSQKFKFSFKRAKELFSISKYYIVSSLLVTVFSQTDRIMLKLMIDSEATGIYAAAATCAGMTSFVFAAIIDSMRPVIFQVAKDEDKTAFHKKMTELYSVIIYFSLIQCVVITLLSPIIIKIMYGDEFVASVDALRIVVWFTTFSYLGSVRNVWMLAENKQKYLWIINLSGALGNVILNLILIPIMGVNGAAVASLCTQIFANVIIGYIVRPISFNNKLMVRGLNPKHIVDMIKSIRKK